MKSGAFDDGEFCVSSRMPRLNAEAVVTTT